MIDERGCKQKSKYRKEWRRDNKLRTNQHIHPHTITNTWHMAQSKNSQLNLGLLVAVDVEGTGLEAGVESKVSHFVVTTTGPDDEFFSR